MICEREEEIAAFVPQEYWSIDAQGEHSQQTFPLKLVEFHGRKVEQFSFTNAAAARDAEQALRSAAGTAGALRVFAVDRKQRRRNPSPPFTTSTLQQEASRKLGFSASRTMRLAQQLYEGIDIGEGSVGLITYMRTDSVTLAAEAVTEMRAVIERVYGPDAVASEIRIYRTKSKNAQEAHEAIRPTSAAVIPADIERWLDPDQLKLYALIWKRALACQMAPAVFDTVAVDMLAGPDGPARHVLRANGSTLVKPGYMAVYQEGSDDAGDDDSDHVLPVIETGDAVNLREIVPQQHFTEPPPRFTEASLVKALEEHGIGRPSTYAAIISTLRDRGYADIESRRFTATDIGKIVNRFLTEHFHRYVDYGFTAAMEDELDAVARGEEPWITPLTKFWEPFIRQVEDIERNVTREQVAQARDLGVDPVSGKPMSVRMGRFGPFVQIGTRDDADKPRFAGLRPGQKMDTITPADALELFKLPRALGSTADGEAVVANIGRFGPYIKFGLKYVSLKDDDPYTVTLERALECIRAKQEADANRIIQDFGVQSIQVLNGRYGPYISNGEKNARIPKDRDPKTLSLEECRALLEAAPNRPQRGRGRPGGRSAAGTRQPSGSTGGAAAGRRAGRAASAVPAEPAMLANAAKSASQPKAARDKPPTRGTVKGKAPAKRKAAAVAPHPAPKPPSKAAPKTAPAAAARGRAGSRAVPSAPRPRTRKVAGAA
jgi:DNA topoisomerase-1